MKLNVKSRTITGKKTKSLRKEGLIPAVMYGRGVEPVLLSCIKNDYIKVYKKSGFSTPFELSGDVNHLVLIQDMQLDPVSDEVITVDFLAVSRTEKVSAFIPVVLNGESPLEKLNEGKVQLVKDAIEVEAFPQDLPHDIQIDVSEMKELHDVVFVRDLKLSEKVKVLEDGDQPVVTIVVLSDEAEDSSDATEEATPAAA